ncbi:MAG: hypothetical protein CM15mP84_10570 [Cellvibrionales bacterium]|nr:MAG: hypothetical protein CM15mP84_10570 [Cellvibrionales bacterium]
MSLFQIRVLAATPFLTVLIVMVFAFMLSFKDLPRVLIVMSSMTAVSTRRLKNERMPGFCCCRGLKKADKPPVAGR